MKNKSLHIDDIFVETKCLSSKSIEKYVTGNVSDAELLIIEKHIADCPFCADAVEGCSKLNNPEQATQIVDSLNNKIKNYPQKEKSRRLHITAYISIAAAVIILIGLFSIFRIKPTENTIAEASRQYSENKSFHDKNHNTENYISENSNNEKNELKKEKAIEKLQERAVTESDKIVQESIEMQKETKRANPNSNKLDVKEQKLISDVEKCLETDQLNKNDIADDLTEKTIKNTNELSEIEEIIFQESNETEPNAAVLFEEKRIKKNISSDYEYALSVESNDFSNADKNVIYSISEKNSTKDRLRKKSKTKDVNDAGILSNDVQLTDISVQLYDQKDYSSAITLFEQILLDKPEDVKARFYCAASYFNNDNSTKAIEYFSIVLKNNSTEYKSRSEWFIALAYIKTKQTKQARTMLNQIIESNSVFKEKAIEALKNLEQ